MNAVPAASDTSCSAACQQLADSCSEPVLGSPPATSVTSNRSGLASCADGGSSTSLQCHSSSTLAAASPSVTATAPASSPAAGVCGDTVTTSAPTGSSSPCSSSTSSDLLAGSSASGAVKKSQLSDSTVIAASDSTSTSLTSYSTATAATSSAATASATSSASATTSSSPSSCVPGCSADATSQLRRSPSDYLFGDEIGYGSFSSVYVAKDVHTGSQVAIKVCIKRHILRERKQAYVVRERDILNHVSQRTADHAPYFVRLFCTFQDAERLYFVMTFARRGDLLSHLTKVGTFDSAVVQFYMSQLLVAVEHLHRVGVIHRDLKPENILLDQRMHVMVSDFGSAKMVTHGDCPLTQSELDCSNPLPCRPSAAGDLPQANGAAAATAARKSFVGTAEYASPELLQDKTTSHASDLWALGCVLYQMVSGLTPFRSRNQYLVFRKILALDYEIPAEGFPPVSADLVRQLLVLDPGARLGAADRHWYTSLRRHAFFDGVDLDTLHQRAAPEIYPFLPGTAQHPELRSTYRVPDHLQPGLTERQLTCGLFNMSLDSSTTNSTCSTTTTATACSAATSPSSSAATADCGGGRGRLSVYRQQLQLADSERQLQLAEQQRTNKWHRFVDNQLIIKYGFLEKRKGLFARRRMFLLTTGPRLFYVEPTSMVLKGEVPWSRELRPEAKNFRNFFVHTPGRTYYLEDTEGYALEWVKAIDEVRLHTYGDETD